MSEAEGERYTEITFYLYEGNGARLSAGRVDGHPHDTVYLKLERPGETDVCILFRPDEMAAIVSLCGHVLFDDLTNKL